MPEGQTQEKETQGKFKKKRASYEKPFNPGKCCEYFSRSKGLTRVQV